MMDCDRKNSKDPLKLQCALLERNTDFSVYFHSDSGQQDLIADCVFNGKYECLFTKDGITLAVDDGNVPTIEVRNTTWKQSGTFHCQQEGQIVNASCPLPPPGISMKGSDLKNLKDPLRLQCPLPEYNKDFSVYFHSVSGQQVLIADCVFKGKYECVFTKDGLNLTVYDNIPTIEVPRTNWGEPGTFYCQQGGQLVNVSFPLPSSGISRMGCDLKNLKGPLTLQCPLLEYNKAFSFYFHSLSGQRALLANCFFKGKYHCVFPKAGFNLTVYDNVPTIEVPRTMWREPGTFYCEQGGQLVNVSCPIFYPGYSTVNSSSTSEVSYSRVSISLVATCSVIGAVAFIILILVVTIWFRKKQKCEKSPERPEMSLPRDSYELYEEELYRSVYKDYDKDYDD